MVDPKEDTEELMPEFRGKVDKAQRIVERINANTDQVHELKGKYQRATTSQMEAGSKSID
jgi:hypothetical protein